MDIAKIGIEANTASLDKAVVSLDRLKAAASGVSASANAVSKAVSGASVQVAAAKASEARATLAALQATKEATKADIAAAKEALKLARAEELKARSLLATAQATNAVTAASKAASSANTRMFNNMASARGGVNPAATGVRIGSPADSPIANDQLPNRFNTGNIAAQFQDIGVTASMGMSPLLIAMQQGTQLSAILNSMESPLEGIAIAFKQILNPIALMSIGFVALAAALIQFIDWTSVAKNILMLMSSGITFVAENLEVLVFALGLAATALTIWNAKAILAATITGANFVVAIGASTAALLVNLATMNLSIVAMGRMATSAMASALVMAKAWILANPVTAFIAGFVAITAALIIFRDNIRDVFGVDIVKFAKDGVNLIVGAFVGAFKYIGQIGKNLWQMMKGDMEISLDNLGKGASDAFSSALKTDYVGAAGDALASVGSKLKEYAGGIGAVTPEIEKATSATEMAKEEVYAYQDALNFTKDTAKGFFQDIATGLKNGELSWKTFGDAVINVLNKIFDKLLDSGFDSLFSGIQSSGGMDSIFSGIQSALFNANGNAFTSAGVQPFAKGGAFTNGVYSSPTMFKFANGGSFGVMGEAGPEAVMPLHRGSDGSLGVKMEGGAGGAVIVNINNYGNSQISEQQTQTSQGIEIDVMIDEAVSKKIGEQGSSTNRALNAYNSRQLIRR
jgi:hypothetical protein